MSTFTIKEAEPLTASIVNLVMEAATSLGREEAMRQAGVAMGINVVALGVTLSGRQSLIARHGEGARVGLSLAIGALNEAVIAENGGRQ